MKLFKNISVAILGIALLAPSGFGQGTAITSTTLSAAITKTQKSFALAGATDVIAPLLPTSAGGIGSSSGASLTLLYVGHEAMEVVSISGTTVTVNRARQGTRAWAHPSGATVYVGAASYFTTYERAGVCVSTTDAPVLPVINVLTGIQYQCDAGTSTWKWSQPQAMFALTITGTKPKAAASATAADAVLTVTGGVGGAQSATTSNGAAGGAILNTGGVGGAGGTSSGTGGAGGALTYTGGAGGGTITGGTGGAAGFTAGAGGAGSSAGGTGGALNLGSGAAGSGGTGTFGALAIKQGATNVLSASTAGATTLASATSGQAINITPAGAGLVSITNNSVALTLPSNVAGGIPLVIGCGATSTGTANCGNTATGGTAHIFSGQATLASNAQVITFGTAFTSTATYACVANDVTTRANVVQMVSTSASTATITNTTGATDAINWICVGY
jgi:hypothetical protein